MNSHADFCDLDLTGYSQSRRMNLRRYDILQNIQISRLCDIRGRSFPYNLTAIYIHSYSLYALM